MRIKDPIFKLICFVLFVTVINEWWIVPSFSHKKPFTSTEIYNAFSIVDMTIWSLIFYRLHTGRVKQFILIGAFVSIMYSLAELFLIKNWRSFHTDSMRVYSISILLFSSLYFYSKLKREYYNLIMDPIFWICCGCFLYHSVLFVSLTTQSRPDYFKFKNSAQFFYILHDTGNTFYYLSLIIAFLICYFRYFNKVQT